MDYKEFLEYLDKSNILKVNTELKANLIVKWLIYSDWLRKEMIELLSKLEKQILEEMDLDALKENSNILKAKKNLENNESESSEELDKLLNDIF